MFKKLLLVLLVCFAITGSGLVFVGCSNGFLDNGEIIVPSQPSDPQPPAGDNDIDLGNNLFDSKEKEKWSAIFIQALIDSGYFNADENFIVKDIENGFTINANANVERFVLDDMGIINVTINNALNDEFIYDKTIDLEINKVCITVLIK